MAEHVVDVETRCTDHIDLGKVSRRALELLVDLQDYLARITGMHAVSVQPVAGAQGELTCLLMARNYFRDRGESRTKVLIPDSAHGTNPASCTMCGQQSVSVKSRSDGRVDLDDLRRQVDDQTAALMITNPNTVGVFDEQIADIAEIVHAAGAQLYLDGANMNAILGVTRPGDFGVDCMHYNTHKTFSTPHGGGGPGAGPVCATDQLARYLAGPIVTKQMDAFELATPEKSIGKVSSFHGNFGVLVRAYTYIRTLGGAGIKSISGNAVLSANYMMNALRGVYHLPYDRTCMHEAVFSADWQKERGASGLEVAKRLLDYGFHAPTMYFPLIVHEALMIEPTESETRETLDAFIQALKDIDREVTENLELVTQAPHTTPVSRLDEALAARRPNLKWTPAA